jgi:hypothetical protein
MSHRLWLGGSATRAGPPRLGNGFPSLSAVLQGTVVTLYIGQVYYISKYLCPKIIVIKLGNDSNDDKI